eukprot:gene8313-859_t
MSKFENVKIEGDSWGDCIDPPKEKDTAVSKSQPSQLDASHVAGQETAQETAQENAQETAKETAQSSSSIEEQQTNVKGQHTPPNEASNDDSLSQTFQQSVHLKAGFTEMITKTFKETSKEVVVQQNDASSPLHSATNFEDVGKQPNTLPIKPEVLRAGRDMNYKSPSKVQSAALPLLLKNPPENLVFQSQPGTGKTAAFTMNMLTRIDEALEYTQAIYISPTFQLCLQTSQVIEALARYTNIKVGLMFGGRDEAIDLENVANQQGFATQQILCCTLKMVVQKLDRRKIIDPNKIRILVVDEADSMLEQGDTFDLLRKLKRRLPQRIQVIMLSATFPDHVLGIADKIAPNANRITIPEKEITVGDIRQLYIITPNYGIKKDALMAIYDALDIKQALVFCNRKQTVDDLENFMKSDGHRVCTMSSDLSKEEQLQQLEEFLNGKASVLIATDMLSRGIDIPQISVVINFDIPRKFKDGAYAGPGFETYTHRVGRLGCFRGGGSAITFVETRDDYDILMSIRDRYGIKMKEVSAEENSLKRAHEENNTDDSNKSHS